MSETVAEDENVAGPFRRVTRIFADGVFDLMHSGHFNAVRQAKALGDWLVVGINSDEEVSRWKGTKPVYNQQERAEMMRECRWVDEVLVGTPYAVSSDFLKGTGCDFIAHGDDIPTCSDGSDCYAGPRRENKVKLFPRTEGISSSALVQKLLDITGLKVGEPASISDRQRDVAPEMLVTTQRLRSFIGARPQPKPQDRIVYIDGSFDIFHVGHVRVLKRARALGDFLIVGIYDDNTVRRMKGDGFPVMRLMERVMNVLAMRMVDEVVIGAPEVVSAHLLRSLNISTVVRGSRVDSPTPASHDIYAVPKRLGIHRELESESSLTTAEILQRIVENREPLKMKITERVALNRLASVGSA